MLMLMSNYESVGAIDIKTAASPSLVELVMVTCILACTARGVQGVAAPENDSVLFKLLIYSQIIF
ncbi:hypothetical protein QTP88_007680 [Uroleucon formosanum]